MGTLSVRNLPDDLKQRLRIRAATNGRSMEEEVRCILRDALARGPGDTGVGGHETGRED